MLTTCTYTAIHLNVPQSDQRKWQSFWRKMKWVMTTVFAPEVVLYCAYAQFSEVWKFVKELNEIRFGKADRRRRWTPLRFLSLFSSRLGKSMQSHADSRYMNFERGKVGRYILRYYIGRSLIYHLGNRLKSDF